ncbi:MAG: hypothetical protein NVS3B24_14700 [Candidatus Dormibacteria bacterium]
MNRKVFVPGAIAMTVAAGVLSVQAALSEPVRQPVNNQLDRVFGSDGISAEAGLASRKITVHVNRPNLDPTFDRVDESGQAALDTVASTAGTAAQVAGSTTEAAKGAVRQTLRDATRTVKETGELATSKVNRAAGTSGTTDLHVPSPVGPAQWNERQLMQRSIWFDAGTTTHTVEVKGRRTSGRMYSLQVLVDGQQTGSQVNVYSALLHLEDLDVPVVIPAVQGNVDLSVGYGYNSSGTTCIASIGADDAACVATAPNPEGLADLRPEVTVSLGWSTMGQPAGSRSIRTPLY